MILGNYFIVKLYFCPLTPKNKLKIFFIILWLISFLFANLGDFYFGLGFGMLFWFTVQILLYLPVFKDYKKEYRRQIYWLERFWISFCFLLYFTNEGSLSSHVFVYSCLFGPTFLIFYEQRCYFITFLYIYLALSHWHIR